ncbi:hypothetical protein EVA_01778 [gut metagenome]|uniref:Exodeoxyribonuclease X-like C-terminal domain-containing protein n=1 Tax=gut metagenome TaxID=749906 RepID=J9GQL1_9ZZZZ
MANPKIPYISEAEETLLYQKLNVYNQGRASYKEEGAYLVVLPQPAKPFYSLWIYSPIPSRQSILYICELTKDIHESMRMASTLCYFSKRPLFIVPYNAKRMQSRGDDIIFFGKYRGHYLHEVLRIDPSYLTWIAYKFEPRIPKQEQFVQIARVYHSVHLDIQRRKTIAVPKNHFIGQVGEKIHQLTLTVLNVHIEDNPYKTQYRNGQAIFYVRQLLKLKDATGNLISMRIQAKTGSWSSCQLPASEHAFQPGEIVHVASAHIAGTYMIGNNHYTRLSHVKFNR